MNLQTTAQSMQYYSGGVYSSSRCSSTELTHAMVITGYGSYNGVDYYLVKNRCVGMKSMYTHMHG